MEERVARLEANVEHIQSDVTDIKMDLRELRRETKSDLKELRQEMLKGFQDVNGKMDHMKTWALLLYFAQAASMMGVMARGFGWL